MDCDVVCVGGIDGEVVVGGVELEVGDGGGDDVGEGGIGGRRSSVGL